MLQVIVGAILLLFPFLLLIKYKDKSLAFVYIFSLWLAFHLFVALVTQLLHIFTYPVLLGANLVLAGAVLGVMRSSWVKPKLFPAEFLKNNWAPLFALALAFICLYSVHYNYSGKYSVVGTSEYKEVKNMKYEYPYFADEWYSAAFIKDSISSRSLPVRNPLTKLKLPFVNFEIAFHSFLSGLFLLLGVEPLTTYPVISLIFNLVICGLIYLFLRRNNIGKKAAAICGLLALYITNGSNLPGLWTLIPFTLGIISILLGFIFLSSGKKMEALLTAVLVLLFYPPFFPFYTLMIILFLLFSKNLSTKEKINDAAYYFSICLVIGFLVSLAHFAAGKGTTGALNEIFSKIFYQTLTVPYNPNFPILSVVPYLALLLLPFGIYSATKKHIWLAASVFLGLAFWIFYSLSTFRVFIEYERVVILTSILIVIVAGFGLEYLAGLLKRVRFFRGNSYVEYLLSAVLICFLFFTFNYTNRDSWKNFTTDAAADGEFLIPLAVANNYLVLDDLEVFKNIHNKIFLSLPWKGTVLGVATNNYPASIKTGTIGIYPYLGKQFMAVSCREKSLLAKAYRLDYVYLPKFTCPEFEFVSSSGEGFYLYQFKKPQAS